MLAFAGLAGGMVAAPISLLAIVFVAWPSFAALGRFGHVSLSVHILAGFAGAVFVVGIISVINAMFVIYPPKILLWPEVTSIVAGGPLAALTYWSVTRQLPPKRVGDQ